MMQSQTGSKCSIRLTVNESAQSPRGGLRVTLIRLLSALNNILIFGVPSLIILSFIGLPPLDEKFRFTGPDGLLLVYALLIGVNGAAIILSLAGFLIDAFGANPGAGNDLKLQFASLTGIGYCVRVNFITVPIYWIPLCGFRTLKRLLVKWKLKM